MRAVLLAVIVLVIATGCSNRAASPTQPVVVDSPTATAASEPTVGTETPAEASATATPARTAGGPPAARLEEAFPGLPDLERPVEMVTVPVRGGVVQFVALQDGRVLWWAGDPKFFDLEGLTALDIRDQVSRDGNEEGLLGMAVDPQFSEGATYIYLYYSVASGERRTRASRFDVTLSSDEGWDLDPLSELVILEVPQPFSNHNGGKIAFGPDGMLYVGLGDGGAAGDPQGNGQNTGTLLGSILRIDVHGRDAGKSYAVPPDNPFASGEGGVPEIWAYGLRNPWRFSFDRDAGDLWVGEVGQDRFEEIDVVERGGNYGWNVMEGSHCYKPGEGCEQQELTLPVAEYDHGGGRCSVAGGYVYRGLGIPSLRGHYVFGDFCTGEIWALNADERTGVVPLINSGLPISSFAEDADGELYVLSFDGRIYRLVE